LRSECINQLAQLEFDNLARTLRNSGIKVFQFDDLGIDTPDSVFPNNWISFHSDGQVILYPMRAINRRKERRMDVLDKLKSQGYTCTSISNYAQHEKDDLFLEGTGSLILDRPQKKLYCAVSERSNEQLISKYSEEFNWTAVTFKAYQTVDKQRKLIYHTNVISFFKVGHLGIRDFGKQDEVQNQLHVFQQHMGSCSHSIRGSHIPNMAIGRCGLIIGRKRSRVSE